MPFDAFARRRVHGAMLDSLRELDWAPRSLRRLRRDVDARDRQPAPRRSVASPRKRKSPTRCGMTVARLREDASSSCARSTSAPCARSTRRPRTARRCSSCASTRRGRVTPARAQGAARAPGQGDRAAARARAADPGALLRGRADAGRNRRGHRRRRVARVAAALAGDVAPRAPAARLARLPEAQAA